MSGLFNSTPLNPMPSFLAAPATTAAPSASTLQSMGPAAQPMGTETWAQSQNLELLSLQQELQRIQAELDRLIASLVAFVPPSGVIGQTWSYLSNLFSGHPTPTAPTPTPPPVKNPGKGGATKFVLSSFNVLSTSAGKGKGFAPGTTRMHWVEEILKSNNVSVVGFQEMAGDQFAEFKKIAGDEYGFVKGASGLRGYYDTTIAWRKDTWKLVDSGALDVPSYEGRKSKVPYVRLRNRQTGQEAYFVDAHNPANTKRHHHQERFRDEAARREAALVDRLIKQTGLPVFLVGDMNSVKEAQQIFTSGAPIKAANPPGRAGIDWIFGSKKGVEFNKFRRERGGLIGRTTDHPVLFTNVKIGGK